MSTTGNEFEQPGVNYPDRGSAAGAASTPGPAEPARDEPPAPEPLGEPAATGESDPSPIGVDVDGDDGDHHGQDGSRDTLTAGEAQRAAGDAETQSVPAMSQNNASDDEKVSGIVAQTRQDVAHLGRERVIEVLHQRLDQSGISVPDGEIDDLARQVLEGGA